MKFSANLVAVAAMLIGAVMPVFAQFPDRPVRVVVPFPPGGGTDILARLTGRHLNEAWKQPVIIDNRAGANGQIGMEIVARADPNGHTLVALAAGPLDEHNLKYFAPVALFAAPPYLFVIHPSVKATSVKEFIALAKSQPGKMNYGSTGGGAASHLSTELFKAMAGVDIHHIPYKGIGQASTELLGGQVQMLIGPSQALIPHVKSGKLRALGITSAKRLGGMPDIPTVAESGLPGYEAYGWFGLAAPARTPPAVLTAINGAVNKALQLPEMKSRLAELGAEPGSYTPSEFLAFIRRENAKWDKLIKDQNIEVQRPRLNL
ncbi:MAG: tripartite tricarboxylate transporter substrate binding protein [Burkholderiales bacterium]|nr:tripartite tricarboxylate transporter substrate binding protein [Burkholderiales bacterium]MDP2398112.1 tripartite tricarboxylate transporter substrate binding protein [Burkholderiales bacterium]